MKSNQFSLLLASFLYFTPTTVADVATFGICLNRTRLELDEPAAHHCHFDSTYCVGDEDWIGPVDPEIKNFPKCTCDLDYDKNVYTHACYNINSHQVHCSADFDGCPEGNGRMSISYRYNSDGVVPESCGDGSDSFGGSYAGNKQHCGKTCTCNFDYASVGEKVEKYTTKYGACTNTNSGKSYCAINDHHCEDGDDWYGPHHTSFPLRDSNNVNECSCHKVQVGACVKKNKRDFKFCAVAADSCNEWHKFLSAKELKDNPHINKECTLCIDETSTPVAPPVQSPVQSPVAKQCYNDMSFKHNKKPCQWMSLAKRRKNKCKIKEVREGCRSMCGTDDCCADHPLNKFKIDSGAKKSCVWLAQKAQRINRYCKKFYIKTLCPKTCKDCGV